MVCSSSVYVGKLKYNNTRVNSLEILLAIAGGVANLDHLVTTLTNLRSVKL